MGRGIQRRQGLSDIFPSINPTWEVLEELCRNKKHPSFVFTYKKGHPIDAHHLSERHFHKAVKKAGVPMIRFHDLRTTYASNFVMAGGDIFALSKLLGHTSVEMTAKKYAALHPRFMKDVVETVQFNPKNSVGFGSSQGKIAHI